MTITIKDWLAPADKPRKPRAKRTYPEFEIQAAVIKWWKQLKRYNKVPAEYILRSNRNTQSATGQQAGRIVAEGSVAGIPDLELSVMKQGYGALYIELKAPVHEPKRASSKGGLSNEQIEIIDNLRKCGYRVEVCYNSNAAIKVIEEYLGL